MRRRGRRAMPYIVAPKRYVPVGVAPSPSRLWLERPERPSSAVQVPRRAGSTCRGAATARARRPSRRLARARSRAAARSQARGRAGRRRRRGRLRSSARMVAVPATLPPFVARVERVTAADLPYSWHSGCPVGPPQLRRIRLSYIGFDGKRQLGALVVNARVVPQVVVVFRTLYRARFPIRRMQPIDAYHGSDDRSAAADNTSGFNCRYAVASGPKSWSMHAYGEAIDVNDLENPYIVGGRVIPPAGRAYATARTYGPEWPSRAACSCARLRASAGAGAATSRARPTTSTSRRTAASPRPQFRRRVRDSAIRRRRSRRPRSSALRSRASRGGSRAS